MIKDDPFEERSENRIETLYNVSRRTVMKAAGVGAMSGGVLTGTAAATEHEDNDDNDDIDDEYGDPDDGEVDEPESFSADVLAPHAPFTDSLSAELTLEFADDHDGDPINVDMDDASSVVFLELNWEPEGAVGWHRHPGSAIVNVVEGELDVVWERDCVTRTYTAGDSFFDFGGVHNATNASESECALAYGVFLGVPEGAPVTEWVEPVDC
jgi:quercetin dioxygenase-like cupin family protein